MSSSERQELILKMKASRIEVGSGVPNKKYESQEIFELIYIANCLNKLNKLN